MANEKSIFEQIIKDDPDNLLKVDLKEDVTQDSTLIDSFREIIIFMKNMIGNLLRIKLIFMNFNFMEV